MNTCIPLLKMSFIVGERTWKCQKWTRKELVTKDGKYYVGIEDIILRRKKYNAEKRRPQGQITKYLEWNLLVNFFFYWYKMFTNSRINMVLFMYRHVCNSELMIERRIFLDRAQENPILDN